MEEPLQQAVTGGLLAALRLPDPALVGTAAAALGHAGLRCGPLCFPDLKSKPCSNLTCKPDPSPSPNPSMICADPYPTPDSAFILSCPLAAEPNWREGPTQCCMAVPLTS